jgi:hypothetical protein
LTKAVVWIDERPVFSAVVDRRARLFWLQSAHTPRSNPLGYTDANPSSGPSGIPFPSMRFRYCLRSPT